MRNVLYRLGGVLYRWDWENLQLVKAGRRKIKQAPGQMAFDLGLPSEPTSPQRGQTRTIGGKTYRLNANSRWERVKESEMTPETVAGLDVIQDEPVPTEPEKSAGHIGFDGKWEYIKLPSGDIARADVSDPIATDGRRFARFESTAAGWVSHPFNRGGDRVSQMEEPAVMESGESLHNQWAAAIDAAYDELASAEEAKKERDDRWKNVFVYKDKKDKRSRYYAYYYDDPETNKSYPYSDREEALNERNFAYEVGDIPLKNRVNEARANLIRLQRDYPEGALLPNPDQRVDPEPDATEQKEPMSIDEQIESIPSQVISKVQSQINSILQWNDKLQRARQTDRMFQGGGRYAWEVTGGVQPDFTRQMQVLDDFREKAANNGLDAEAILQRLGYEDPLQLKENELDDAHAPTPTPPAEPEVMDEPAVMEEDDRPRPWSYEFNRLTKDEVKELYKPELDRARGIIEESKEYQKVKGVVDKLNDYFYSKHDKLSSRSLYRIPDDPLFQILNLWKHSSDAGVKFTYIKGFEKSRKVSLTRKEYDDALKAVESIQKKLGLYTKDGVDKNDFVDVIDAMLNRGNSISQDALDKYQLIPDEPAVMEEREPESEGFIEGSLSTEPAVMEEDDRLLTEEERIAARLKEFELSLQAAEAIGGKGGQMIANALKRQMAKFNQELNSTKKTKPVKVKLKPVDDSIEWFTDDDIDEETLMPVSKKDTLNKTADRLYLVDAGVSISL